MAAEDARAALRREWRSGVEDPCAGARSSRRRSATSTASSELVRRRRDEIAKLEEELTARRRRVRDRLRPLKTGVGSRS